jgi:type I restriction enzyme R subunit
LQEDRDVADISDIIKQLHEVVDESIVVEPDKAKDSTKPYDISKIDFNRLRAEFNTTKKKNTTVQNLKTVIEKKLQQLVQKNPLRTNFQEHYERIIAEYNKEKDRQNIEETFEALLKFVQGLDEEENRAMREGMDEETLAIYDLLSKPDLSAKEIQKIKKVAKELLVMLKEKLKNLYRWQDKEPTRDEVSVLIKNFLWDDKTGLPVEYYSQKDVAKIAKAVYYHIYRAYPTVPSPYYAAV